MNDKNFDYSIEKTYLVFTIHVREMIFGNSMTMSSDIKTILAARDYPDTILNLEEVDYIDSCSIGTIITLYNQLKEKNKKMIIVSENKMILKTFDYYQVNKFITILPSLSEAVQKIT